MLKWFRSKSIFRFERKKLHEFEGRDVISEVQNGKLDGVVIKQVLEEGELQQIRRGIQSMNTEDFSKVGDIYTLPDGFASYSNSTKENNDYFLENALLPGRLKEMFQFDFSERLKQVFTQISNGRIVKVPAGPNGVGSYAGSTIRVLNAGTTMNTHCGNFFYEPYYEFYKDLESKVHVYNQLSYFILIESPREAGELVLFNLRWKNGQKKEVDQADLLVISQPDTKPFIWKPAMKKASETIDMEAGDMIVFAGGEIWHFVSPPRGEISRKTIGGFIGSSKLEEEALYYWS